MKKKKSLAKSKFQVSVESTPQIRSSYCQGLQALGNHSNKIQLAGMCQGSVDIDTSVEKIYPQENRWDYCFAYKDEVYFCEVHSAYSNEVRTVLNKLQWLKNWLITHAPQLNALKAKSNPPFYWIQSNGFHIPQTSRQYRQVIQEKIKPGARIVLK